MSVAQTQDALYAEIDLELSWSERELPERERTKHVHRLHPYLGKFIPQLVEVLLERYVAAGRPRARPVRRLGHDARPGARVGPRRGRRRPGRVQLPARCASRRARYNEFVLETELRDAVRRLESLPDASEGLSRDSGYIGQWFAPRAGRRAARLAVAGRRVRARRRDARRARPRRALGAADDPLRPRLPARAAARAVLVLQAPARVPPVEHAAHFLRRYALDTLARIKAFARVRARGREALVLHGDARELDWAGRFDAVDHLAAVSGADRLPRAAPLRLRAARARRPARARARRRRGRDEQGGARRLRRRDRRRARDGPRRSLQPGAPRADRRQRPARPLPGDPRARRPAARRTGCAGTSTAAPAGARASTSRTCSSPSRLNNGTTRPTQTRRHDRRATRRTVLARTVTHALVGLEPRRVEVEAHLQRGVPGVRDRRARRPRLPGGEGARAQRHRVGRARVAASRRITVNLAPAGLRKEGSGFDLPIALAILAASRQIPRERARRARGARRARARRPRAAGRRASLAAAEGARRAGLTRLLCAAESAPEAALAGVEPVPLRHLAEAVAYLRGEGEPPPYAPPANGARTGACAPDLADVRGQERARRALEIAAAGSAQPAARRPAGHRQDDARPAAARHPAAARRATRRSR